MRPAAVILALVLLAPQAAGWTQLRGEADRSSSVTPPRGVLDVIGMQRMGADTQAILGRATPYAVSLGEDVGTLVVSNLVGSRACTFLRGSFGTGFSGVALSGCEDGRLQAYWPQGESLLVCMTAAGRSGVVASYATGGAQQWVLDPRQAFAVAGDSSDATESNWQWSCEGAALYGNRAIVPFFATSSGTTGARHHIAWINMADGTVAQSAQVPAAALAPGLVPAGASNPDFLPLTVTAIDTGIAVAGLVACPSSPACRAPTDSAVGYAGAVGWMDHQGTTYGVEVARVRDANDLLEEEATRPVPVVSAFGAGHRGLIAAQVGRNAILVDPTTSQVRAVDVNIHESGDSLTMWPGPVWMDGAVAVPTDRQITFLDRSGAPLGNPWTDLDDSMERIVDLAADRNNRLFILSVRLERSTWGPSVVLSTNATLSILDEAAGAGRRLLHQLPLSVATVSGSDPIFATERLDAPQFGWMQAPMFIEHAGELSIVDARGHLVRLADRGEEPPLAVSNAFPLPSETIELRLESDGAPVRALVRWGDGTTDELAWPADGGPVGATHFYTRPGRYDLVATVLDADGTTRTAAQVIDVGGTPPQRLNAIQVAFGEDYRDTTWGIIGLLVAFGGGAYAWVRIQRSRSRLQSALGRLHQIREQGRTDPMGALRGLQELRREVEDRAAVGFYEHGQVVILENHMARAAGHLMLQAVHPFRERLNPVYRSMLVGFFEDGRIGRQEAEMALASLSDQKRLSRVERRQVAELFRILQP